MPAEAAAIGGALISGALASKGAKDAAKTQARSADAATQAQLEMFDKQMAAQEPWRLAGMGALPSLLYMAGMPMSPALTQNLGNQLGYTQDTGAGSSSGGGNTSSPVTVDAKYLTDMGYTEHPNGIFAAPGMTNPYSYDDSGMIVYKNGVMRSNGDGTISQYVNGSWVPFPVTLPTSGGEGSGEGATPDYSWLGNYGMAPSAPGSTGTAMSSDRMLPMGADLTATDASGVPAWAAQYGPDLQRLASLQLPALPEEFVFNQDDPSYQFRMNEGIKALERSAAARGMLDSGRAGKDILRYAQDYASTEYNNAFNRYQIQTTNDWNRQMQLANTEFNRGAALGDTQWNRLASIAGIGQTATNQMMTPMQQTGTNLSNIALSNGAAQANSSLAQAQIWGNVLNGMPWSDIGNAIGNWSLWNSNTPQPTTYQDISSGWAPGNF